MIDARTAQRGKAVKRERIYGKNPKEKSDTGR